MDFWEAQRRERVAWVEREESMVVACVLRWALRASIWDWREEISVSSCAPTGSSMIESSVEGSMIAINTRLISMRIQ